MQKLVKSFNAIVIIGLLMVYGCNPAVVPLKTKYSETVFEVNTTESMDTAWSKVENVFKANGLRLKSVDRNKGMILTTKGSLSSIYTFEDKEGRLIQPEAWVVLPKVINKNKEWKPKVIYGQWSIRIIESEKGMRTVKIDPVVVCTSYPNTFTVMENRGQSTGKLEALIERSLRVN